MRFLFSCLKTCGLVTFFLTKLTLFLFSFFCFLITAFIFSILIVDSVSLEYQLQKFEKAKDFNVLTSYKPDVIHILLPKTKWIHVKPCALYFDELEEFKKALECANKKAWLKEQELKNINLPACYVITKDSPDVYSENMINYGIFRLGDHQLGAIMGFYAPKEQRTFLVENLDIKMIYRHEMQHHFLNVHESEHEVGNHQHKIFEVCEPGYYEPTENTLKIIELLKNE